MNFNNIKYKNGLFWLVFCLVVFIILDRHPEFISGSENSSNKILKQVQNDVYSQGFLETLGARGHVIEKHVGKSDEYLRQRLSRERISAASTFNDMAEAENAVRAVLTKRGDLVQAWIATERSNKKAFYWHIDKPVGRVLRRGWRASKAGNQTRVVLVRDGQTPQKFIILTAYPESK